MPFSALVDESAREEGEANNYEYPDHPLVGCASGGGYLVDEGDADYGAHDGADVHEPVGRGREVNQPGSRMMPSAADLTFPITLSALSPYF